MTSEQKEILASLLEQLIEDVVTTTEERERRMQTWTLSQNFVWKVSIYVELNEKERDALLSLVDDFLERVCSKLEEVHSKAVDLSALIRDFIEETLHIYHETHVLYGVIEKLTYDLVNEFRKQNLSVESSRTEVCSASCSGYENGGIPLEENEERAGDEMETTENVEREKKVGITDSELSFLHSLIDRTISYVIREAYLPKDESTVRESGSQQNRESEFRDHQPQTARRKSPCPQTCQKDRCRSVCSSTAGRRFFSCSKILLLYYLCLLPLTIFIGASFGIALCRPRPCFGDWPLFLKSFDHSQPASSIY